MSQTQTHTQVYTHMHTHTHTQHFLQSKATHTHGHTSKPPFLCMNNGMHLFCICLVYIYLCYVSSNSLTPICCLTFCRTATIQLEMEKSKVSRKGGHDYLYWPEPGPCQLLLNAALQSILTIQLTTLGPSRS